MQASDVWPDLPFPAWKATYETLLRYTQIVGKVQLELTPRVNHWWNVAFHVDARGLRTGLMPYDRGFFEVAFDFLDHQLIFRTSAGQRRALSLVPRAVADFEREVFAILESLGIEVAIYQTPSEQPEPIVPFPEDFEHASYDGDAAQKFWRILLQSQAVFEEFRARFVGKGSPILFYWGSFDLAVTRFSGRSAPPRPDADVIIRESFFQEESSAGLWPGNDELGEPAFYSYTLPSPAGFETAKVQPSAAYFHQGLGEFILPYGAVRSAPYPRETLLAFLQSTYEAAARLAAWDRSFLERSPSFEQATPTAEETAPLPH